MNRVLLLAVTLSLTLSAVACGRDPNVVVVGSKNFTESIILGELLAQQLERNGFAVERKLNLGGSYIAHQAMTGGQLDMYVEYTGTAHSAILELPIERNPATVRHTVDSTYRTRWNLEWMEPLGFNNTFAMLVRGETARNLEIASLSEAVPYARQWQAAFGFEFAGRPDGLPGLRQHYGLVFAQEPATMDLSLTYRALAEGRVDIIAGNSTDGQIEALGLVHLADDLAFFPPYEAIPVVRGDLLERHPSIRKAINELGGSVTEEQMRHLNYLVDARGYAIPVVVETYLTNVNP